MRKLYLIFIFLLFLNCTSSDTPGDSKSNKTTQDCGVKVVKGVSKKLHIGPRGGCYYINDNGNKSYVDRSDCKC